MGRKCQLIFIIHYNESQDFSLIKTVEKTYKFPYNCTSLCVAVRAVDIRVRKVFIKKQIFLNCTSSLFCLCPEKIACRMIIIACVRCFVFIILFLIQQGVCDVYYNTIKLLKSSYYLQFLTFLLIFYSFLEKTCIFHRILRLVPKTLYSRETSGTSTLNYESPKKSGIGVPSYRTQGFCPRDPQIATDNFSVDRPLGV